MCVPTTTRCGRARLSRCQSCRCHHRWRSGNNGAKRNCGDFDLSVALRLVPVFFLLRYTFDVEVIYGNAGSMEGRRRSVIRKGNYPNYRPRLNCKFD